MNMQKSRQGKISTHALTEGDVRRRKVHEEPDYFNSRPHGGRRRTMETKAEDSVFQLTPSRRATISLETISRTKHISTHALTEGDFLQSKSCLRHSISTHALTEGDKIRHRDYSAGRISTHALTEGDRLQIVR